MSISTEIECRNISILGDLLYLKNRYIYKLSALCDDIESLVQHMSKEDIDSAYRRFFRLKITEDE